MIYLKKKIKPLSVNECWQGKRYKTEKYKNYEKLLLLTLPTLKIPAPPYFIVFKFYMNRIDWDNPIKPLQDILQKKYGFDDKDVVKGLVEKIKCKKGEESFEITLGNIKDFNTLLHND